MNKGERPGKAMEMAMAIFNFMRFRKWIKTERYGIGTEWDEIE